MKPSDSEGSQKVIMRCFMVWLMWIWWCTETTHTCHEGAWACCCTTTSRLNERGMRRRTLPMPLVIIGAQNVWQKSIKFLRKHKSLAKHRLFCHSALEMRTQKSTVHCFLWLRLGNQHSHLNTWSLKSRFKCQVESYDQRCRMEQQLISVIMCSFHQQKSWVGLGSRTNYPFTLNPMI